MKSKNISYLIVFFCLSTILFLAAKTDSGDKITGVWLTGNTKAKIKIEKAGNKYFGKIIWIKDPIDKDGKPALDDKNPDEKLKKEKIVGLKLLKDFVYEGDNSWKDGSIYDPESGKTYSCKITMKDNNTLDVRGYIGVSLFGRTDTWTRQKE